MIRMTKCKVSSNVEPKPNITRNKNVFENTNGLIQRSVDDEESKIMEEKSLGGKCLSFLLLLRQYLTPNIKGKGLFSHSL